MEAFQTHPSLYERIISIKQIKANDVNRSRLAGQEPSSGRCSRQGNIGHHHVNSAISKRRKWPIQENKIIMKCYLLSEPKVRGYRKRMLSLWLNKGIFWVSEQRLVDQPYTVHRNSWMTQLQTNKLERNLAGNRGNRGTDDTGKHLGEEVREISTVLEADKEIGNLEEEEVAIIEEIAGLKEDRKMSYQLL